MAASITQLFCAFVRRVARSETPCRTPERPLLALHPAARLLLDRRPSAQIRKDRDRAVQTTIPERRRQRAAEVCPVVELQLGGRGRRRKEGIERATVKRDTRLEETGNGRRRLVQSRFRDCTRTGREPADLPESWQSVRPRARADEHGPRGLCGAIG